MLSCRPFVIPAVCLAAGLAGCASAGSADPAQGTPDASSAPGSGGSQHADAGTGTGQHVDAGHSDAPMSSGTCAMPVSGVLATWSFAGATGSQTSTAPSSTAGGVVAGAIKRSAALTAVSGAGSINASNWPSAAALDTTKYFTFTVAPPAGCTLSVSSIAIDAHSSSTGPASAALGSSTDSYGATTPVSTTTAGTVALAVTGATGTVEVRIYGWSASSTSGTMRVQNTLSVTGSLQ